MPVLTAVACCDYHAPPKGEPAPIWCGGVDIRSWPRSDRDRYGDRQGYIALPVPATGRHSADRARLAVRSAMTVAVEHDHGDCGDASCDIAAMIAAGYSIAAYHALASAGDAPAVTNMIAALDLVYGRETVTAALGTHLYDCPDWQGWKTHHDTYYCEACGSYTYAGDWEPDACGVCEAPLVTG